MPAVSVQIAVLSQVPLGPQCGHLSLEAGHSLGALLPLRCLIVLALPVSLHSFSRLDSPHRSTPLMSNMQMSMRLRHGVDSCIIFGRLSLAVYTCNVPQLLGCRALVHAAIPSIGKTYMRWSRKQCGASIWQNTSAISSAQLLQQGLMAWHEYRWLCSG